MLVLESISGRTHAKAALQGRGSDPSSSPYMSSLTLHGAGHPIFITFRNTQNTSAGCSTWPGLLQIHQGEGFTHLQISLRGFICSSCFIPTHRKSWRGRASWPQGSSQHWVKALLLLWGNVWVVWRNQHCLPHCLEKGKIHSPGFFLVFTLPLVYWAVPFLPPGLRFYVV